MVALESERETGEPYTEFGEDEVQALVALCKVTRK